MFKQAILTGLLETRTRSPHRSIQTMLISVAVLMITSHIQESASVGKLLGVLIKEDTMFDTSSTSTRYSINRSRTGCDRKLAQIGEVVDCPFQSLDHSEVWIRSRTIIHLNRFCYRYMFHALDFSCVRLARRRRMLC